MKKIDFIGGFLGVVFVLILLFLFNIASESLIKVSNLVAFLFLLVGAVLGYLLSLIFKKAKKKVFDYKMGFWFLFILLVVMMLVASVFIMNF